MIYEYLFIVVVVFLLVALIKVSSLEDEKRKTKERLIRISKDNDTYRKSHERYLMFSSLDPREQQSITLSVKPTNTLDDILDNVDKWRSNQP